LHAGAYYSLSSYHWVANAELLADEGSVEGDRVAAIAVHLKEIGSVALHLPPNNTDLNPIQFVCGDIKNRIASTNLK
jgi:transposase